MGQEDTVAARFERELRGFISLLRRRPIVAAGLLVIGACALAWNMYLGEFFRTRIHTQSENVPTPSTAESDQLPNVLLAAETGRLILYNRGKTDFYLWGDSFDGSQDFSGPPVIVPKDGFYYILTDKLEKWALQVIGTDGERRVPLDLYFSDSSKQHRSLGKFALLIQMTDGSMSVHTQMLGIEASQWAEAQ